MSAFVNHFEFLLRAFDEILFVADKSSLYLVTHEEFFKKNFSKIFKIDFNKKICFFLIIIRKRMILDVFFCDFFRVDMLLGLIFCEEHEFDIIFSKKSKKKNIIFRG